MDQNESEAREVNNLWKCGNCGNTFIPNPPSFSCPKCRSNATSPSFPSKKVVLEREPEKMCPNCQSVMRVGFLVERNTPISVLTLGEGIYWSPGEAGVIGNRVALKSYACPECGYVSLHVRRLEKDKDKILKAPIRERKAYPP